jgi:hypothetical protein
MSCYPVGWSEVTSTVYSSTVNLIFPTHEYDNCHGECAVNCNPNSESKSMPRTQVSMCACLFGGPQIRLTIEASIIKVNNNLQYIT